MTLEAITLDDLTMTCTLCDGRGGTPARTEHSPFRAVHHPAYKCDRCHGAGKILNDSGRAIVEALKLAMLNRNWKV